MSRVAIIVPHIDDDILSCFSVYKYYKDVDLYICSYGYHQQLRLPAYDLMKEWCNINIHSLGLFEDGHSDEKTILSSVKPIEQVFETHEIVYYPATSHHQDHSFVNNLCLIGMRYRNSLPNKQFIYEYSYVYNEGNITNNTWLGLNAKDYSDKIKILTEMDNLDNILKDRVMSIDSIKHKDCYEGSKVNNYAAESFKLIRSVM